METGLSRSDTSYIKLMCAGIVRFSRLDQRIHKAVYMHQASCDGTYYFGVVTLAGCMYMVTFLFDVKTQLYLNFEEKQNREINGFPMNNPGFVFHQFTQI